MRKRTKIIATLGPATSSTKIICNLIKEGTDVFRINLSHSNVKDIKDILSGANYQTEFVLPPSWGYDSMDSLSLKDIHSK